jgi:hypothetical protein
MLMVYLLITLLPQAEAAEVQAAAALVVIAPQSEHRVAVQQQKVL